MVVLVSRSGRHLQRYNKGRRLVVGCIPYKYKDRKDGAVDDEFEVLVISSQNGQGMLFPKGGWELDESAKEAASRETLEEAGVLGNVERELGRWRFKSKSQGIFHEGYMFPLLVTEQLDLWPEKNVRKREWMTVSKAREVCKHWWMKEALDKLVDRLMPPSVNDNEDVSLVSVSILARRVSIDREVACCVPTLEVRSCCVELLVVVSVGGGVGSPGLPVVFFCGQCSLVYVFLKFSPIPERGT